MSESTEPSYYEIALTNRQVVIAFVILLTLVLAIFLCGVWIGKNGQERLAQIESAPGSGGETATAAGTPDQLANMEEFKFFAEEGAGVETDGEPLDRPNLAVLDKPKRDTTLAQEVGSDRQGSKTDGAPTSQSPPPSKATQQPSSPAQSPANSAPPPKPAAQKTTASKTTASKTTAPKTTAPKTTAPSQAAAATGDGFVVQVFSTRDEPQARKVLDQLKGAGHQAFLSAVEVTGQTMYRVRVGPFSQRNAAEKIAGQVRRQMKLDPWVTAAGN